MIYFDNAATCLIKPQCVAAAMNEALCFWGNPGRSGHGPSLRCAAGIYECREKVCAFFDYDRPENVIFTSGATESLNIAVRSCLKQGSEALISGYEHNAVTRPLQAIGCSVRVVGYPPFDAEAAIEGFKMHFARKKPDCVIINHVSNVFGFCFPALAVSRMCADAGVPLVLDASQSAGNIPISIKSFKRLDYLCAAGHKSLMGPPGTGILICCSDVKPMPLKQGGTGSSSDGPQPDFLPDALESGTPNYVGIAGLSAALSYISERMPDYCAAHKKRLVKRIAEGLSCVKGAEVFTGPDQLGVLSFRGRKNSEEICSALSERGICARGGLHCSPLAHQTAGTFCGGTARLSFSPFNTIKEADYFLKTVEKIL